MNTFYVFPFLVFSFCFLSIEGRPQEEEHLHVHGSNSHQEVRKAVIDGLLPLQYDLLSHLQRDSLETENILLPPFTYLLSLTSLYAAAGEKTRNELAKIMHLPENEEVHKHLHEVMKNLVDELQTNKNAEMVFANGFFVQKDAEIKESFREKLKKYYNGTATSVDFTNNAQQATDEINRFVSQQTKDRIPKLYTEPLDESTYAVLVNTLYFKSTFSEQFDELETKVEKFNTGKEEIDVPMMNKIARVSYMNDSDLQFESISIPYQNNEFQLSIFLPYRTQTVQNLIDNMRQLVTRKTTPQNQYVPVDYKIPKIKFSTRVSLVKPSHLEEVFRHPDLSEMTSSTNVKISDMVQACEFETDEKGTTASAVTAVEFQVTMAGPQPPQEPIKFQVDRPFLIQITHRPTNVNLFIGIINRPVRSRRHDMA